MHGSGWIAMRHQSADCREARIPLPTAVGAPRRSGPVYAGSMNGCLRTLVHWTPELGGQDAWLEERRAAGWSPSTRGSPIRSSSTGGRCGLSPSSTSRTHNRGLSFAASACELSSAGPRARRLRRVSDRGGWWSTAIEGAAGSARSVDAERALVDVVGFERRFADRTEGPIASDRMVGSRCLAGGNGANSGAWSIGYSCGA